MFDKHCAWRFRLVNRETFLLKFGKVGEQGIVCRDRLVYFVQV